MRRLPPRSTLFPYTTLFRSIDADRLRLPGLELARLHLAAGPLDLQRVHDLPVVRDPEGDDARPSDPWVRGVEPELGLPDAHRLDDRALRAGGGPRRARPPLGGHLDAALAVLAARCQRQGGEQGGGDGAAYAHGAAEPTALLAAARSWLSSGPSLGGRLMARRQPL